MKVFTIFNPWNDLTLFTISVLDEQILCQKPFKQSLESCIVLMQIFIEQKWKLLYNQKYLWEIKLYNFCELVNTTKFNVSKFFLSDEGPQWDIFF